MNIKLRPVTERLLKQQMTRANCQDADAMIHAALVSFQEIEGPSIEELDPETQSAIARAEAQSNNEEGRPWAEVKCELSQRFT